MKRVDHKIPAFFLSWTGRTFSETGLFDDIGWGYHRELDWPTPACFSGISIPSRLFYSEALVSRRIEIPETTVVIALRDLLDWDEGEWDESEWDESE